MKNLKKVADKSKVVCPDMKLPLYYSIEKDTVYYQPGEGRYHVTNLINPNTEADIVEVVTRWKNM